MRIREPKTTALIFASGKMVVTGAKSEDDSKLASRKYARIIQKLGFNAKFTDFKIQNIVGSCDIKFPIRLEGLASRHHNFSSYEPELFPGLIYRMIKPKIVLLIFVSGKIVLTGAKVREEIYQAFEMIYPVLQGMLVPLWALSLLGMILTIRRFPKGLSFTRVTSPHTRPPQHHKLHCTIPHDFTSLTSPSTLTGSHTTRPSNEVTVSFFANCIAPALTKEWTIAEGWTRSFLQKRKILRHLVRRMDTHRLHMAFFRRHVRWSRLCRLNSTERKQKTESHSVGFLLVERGWPARRIRFQLLQ